MSDEPHVSAGAYALDALPEEDRAEFEEHLAGCPVCQQDVPQLRAAAAGLAAFEEVTPPASLRSRVLAAISRTPQLQPTAAPGARGRRRAVLAARSDPAQVAELARGLRVWRVVAAAATIALAGGSIAFAVQQRQLDRTRARLEQVQALLPDADGAAHAPVRGGGTAGVLVSGNRVLVTVRGLPPLPAGRAYQMWVINASGPTSRGILVLDGNSGTADFSLVSGATAVAMSVEPATGSTSPTTEPVTVVPLA